MDGVVDVDAPLLEDLAELLDGVESLDWTITIPEPNALDAVVRLHPTLDPESKR